MARRFRLICFDEFHVADVADAMILHRLLQSLFDNRASIVTTSNFHPRPVPERLHRDRILPAIELLLRHLEVINVDAGVGLPRRRWSRWSCTHCRWTRLPKPALMTSLRPSGRDARRRPAWHIEHRELRAVRAGGVVISTSAPLCGGPRLQNDYLELATLLTPCCCRAFQKCRRLASEARASRGFVDVVPTAGSSW